MTRVIKLATVLAVASLLAACAAETSPQSRQFNLQCTGESWSRVKGKDDATRRRADLVYRVDLDAGKWCVRDCDRILDVVSVSDEQIVLWDFDSRATDGEEWMTVRTTLNRLTGEAETVRDEKWLEGGSISRCQRRRFTGLGQF